MWQTKTSTIIFLIIAAAIVASFNFNVTNVESANDTMIYLNQSSTLSPSEDGITSSSIYAYNNTFLAFDGVDDYVSIDPALPLKSSTNNNFSVCIWAKGESLNVSKDYSLIQGYNNSFSTNSFRFRYASISGNHRLSNTFYNSTGSLIGSIVGTTNINTSQWNHICFTKQSLNITQYLNGSFLYTANMSSETNLAVNGIYVSNSIGSQIFFNGNIDEVRIYNRTLSDSEITEIYNSGRVANSSLPSTGLVAWYKLNEGTGTTAYDSSGNGNTGTLVGFD